MKLIPSNVFSRYHATCLLVSNDKSAPNDSGNLGDSRAELSHYFIYRSIKFYVYKSTMLNVLLFFERLLGSFSLLWAGLRYLLSRSKKGAQAITMQGIARDSATRLLRIPFLTYFLFPRKCKALGEYTS